jgi:hypothetical protein
MIKGKQIHFQYQQIQSIIKEEELLSNTKISKNITQ